MLGVAGAPRRTVHGPGAPVAGRCSRRPCTRSSPAVWTWSGPGTWPSPPPCSTDDAAREVQDQLLGAAGHAPWAGLSPRAWRARVARAVVRADVAAARERAAQETRKRLVRARATGYGMGELLVIADAADVAMAEQVLTDLANTRPERTDDGEYVTMDQRRVDAFVDVFTRIRDGHPLPGVPVRRERELALVVHADTFFGDGPAANDPGETRGARRGARPGRPGHRPRTSPRVTAATGATNVLLVDTTGTLHRMVRLPTAPAGGWTRQLLDQASAARLDTLPALCTDLRADGGDHRPRAGP